MRRNIFFILETSNISQEKSLNLFNAKREMKREDGTYNADVPVSRNRIAFFVGKCLVNNPIELQQPCKKM